MRLTKRKGLVSKCWVLSLLLSVAGTLSGCAGGEDVTPVRPSNEPSVISRPPKLTARAAKRAAEPDGRPRGDGRH